MKYNYLGRSGVKVSELCLGAMMFGGAADERVSNDIIASAREAGVNFIDTADMYNGGESERVVGKAVAADRENWVLATKVGNPMGSGPNEKGMSRKWIMQAVDASLKRLGTDYIDLLYIHKADFAAPLAEMVHAFADLVHMGKINYFGVSNFKAWRMAETVALAEKAGIQGPIATQPLYNIVNREAEVEHLPAADFYGLGAVTYSPLARGILTGKYRPNASPEQGSRAARGDVRMMEAEWRPESLLVAEKLVKYAESKGANPAHIAQQWVMKNSFVSSTIVGPRTLEQWHDYVDAMEYRYTEADEAFVDLLVSPGKTSTLAPSDPHHPIEGRKLNLGSGL
jgi:aryl-alcohol dehydrogenase-like predicted oxidoreductase